MEDSINKILSTIDDAINRFQSSIPGIQKLVYDELQPLIKKIEIKDGKLLNNVTNLKLLGTLKNKLENVIVNAQYQQSVNNFIESFTIVSNLQQDYFKQFNKDLKPKKTLPIIKQLAIEATINDLIGQGMSSNVIDPIQKILNQNITSGGDYAEFQDQLRNHILTNDTGEGSLERYTKQITTDSIHQYNAQYHDAIAQDLNFSWGRYVGSNIKTSREFCIRLTKKQWVKKADLPEIIKGHIDGHDCILSKTTKLPLGMIPDTNVDNFKIYRGGYNCGHQFFWVPDSSVPADIIVPKIILGNDVISTIRETNKISLEALGSRGIIFPDELLQLMPDNIKIIDQQNAGSYYSPQTQEIVIGGKGRASNKYYQKKIVLHESGHAIHFNKRIITDDHVDPDFISFYKKLQTTIEGKESILDNLLWKAMDNSNSVTKREQITMLQDTLGGLTKGRYGAGHSLGYYNHGNYSMMEVFAHSISLARLENEFSNIDASMSEVVSLMKAYGSNILKGI